MGVESILVLLLVLTPGLLADGLYRFLLWRPDPHEQTRLTRAILFSAAGLLLLLFVADLVPGTIQKPEYLVSTWWNTAWRGDLSSATDVAIPWLQHTFLACLLSLVAAAIIRWRWIADVLRSITGQSFHRNAWDEFAAANHKKWIFVRLTDGRHYYGELGVVSGDRKKDLVLWHPYPYREKDQTYEVTGARALFIPGEQVASILLAEERAGLAAIQDKLGVYSLITGERVT
jgi:hypothetical protein